MPKRRHEETDEDRWRRKMRRYQKKLEKRKPQIIYSSEGEDFEQQQEPEEFMYTDPEVLPEVLQSLPDVPTVDSEVNSNDFPITAAEPTASVSSELPAAPPPPPPVPAPADTADVPLAPEIDPDLLQALGDCHTDTPEWGDDILQDISQRWEPILKQGLKKEIKEDLHKKYLLPKNVPSSKAPELNPEISAMLTEACRNRDSRLCTKQGQLGRVIAALGKAMTGILAKSMNTPDILKILNDAGKLLADSHYMETDTRRSLITPLLDKSYVTPFKDRKRDNFLFGEKLGDFIKSSRGIKKTGQLITPPTPSTSTSASSSNLNWRGPSRQQPRSNRGGASRGGQRAPPASARRPPAPPPPAPRRPPPQSANNRRQPAQSTSRSRNST